MGTCARGLHPCVFMHTYNKSSSAQPCGIPIPRPEECNYWKNICATPVRLMLLQHLHLPRIDQTGRGVNTKTFLLYCALPLLLAVCIFLSLCLLRFWASWIAAVFKIRRIGSCLGSICHALFSGLSLFHLTSVCNWFWRNTYYISSGFGHFTLLLRTFFRIPS